MRVVATKVVSSRGPSTSTVEWGRWLPALVFLVLTALTILVWQEQVAHQRGLLLKHAEETCRHASRRLESFVDSRLMAVELFARRWATHDYRDFSRRRFEDFATVLMQEIPGYHSLQLVPMDLGGSWTVTPAGNSDGAPPATELAELLRESRRQSRIVVSRPVWIDSAPYLYAGLILLRGAEQLGYFLVAFRVEDLVARCVPSQLEADYRLIITDGDQVFWRMGMGAKDRPRGAEVLQNIPIRNRRWQLALVGRTELSVLGTGSSRGVLVLGLSLSLGLALLLALLARRMGQARAARDEAVRENVERGRVEVALRASEQRLSALSRKVLAAQEEERGRISRELHDELGQLLTALRFDLEWLGKHPESEAAKRGEVLASAIQLTEKSAAELRRICQGLRPPLLDDLGLEPAVLHLVQEFTEHTGIPVDLQLALGHAAESIPIEVGLCIYRILQEALTNVRRHSGAKRVTVELRRVAASLFLRVSDDGCGFDPSVGSRGAGLAGMRERANLVKACLEISSVPGQGTRVEVVSPVVSAA